MVALITSATTLAQLTIRLERGDFEGALAAALRGAPTMLSTSATEAFVAAASDTADAIGEALGEIIIGFDQTNFRAVAAMRENQLRLIQGFTQQQRDAARQALIEGITEGLNPREIARRFRESIGLTANQERAVSNYRRALEDLDRDALRRQLRDRRFDPTVERAIANDRPLTRSQVDRMTERYRQRMLIFRSETIARTEALRSVHAGAHEMYLQAIENGELNPDTLAREWNTARDERVRSSHRFMHGQKRGVLEPFLSGDGNQLMFPGDPRAPASDTIECRCAVGTRITAFEGLETL
jgi:hypothetical protein